MVPCRVSPTPPQAEFRDACERNREIYLVTGIQAAGKSTVGQALAERLPRSVHIRGDLFRRMIVNGRAEMTPDPTSEAVRQLRLRYELAATVTDGRGKSAYGTWQIAVPGPRRRRGEAVGGRVPGAAQIGYGHAGRS